MINKPNDFVDIARVFLFKIGAWRIAYRIWVCHTLYLKCMFSLQHSLFLIPSVSYDVTTWFRSVQIQIWTKIDQHDCAAISVMEVRHYICTDAHAWSDRYSQRGKNSTTAKRATKTKAATDGNRRTVVTSLSGHVKTKQIELKKETLSKISVWTEK